MVLGCVELNDRDMPLHLASATFIRPVAMKSSVAILHELYSGVILKSLWFETGKMPSSVESCQVDIPVERQVSLTGLTELHTRSRVVDKLIHEETLVRLKRQLSGSNGIECVEVVTEGCGVYLGRHRGYRGGVSQQMCFKFDCMGDYVVYVEIEYVTDCCDLHYFDFLIDVTSLDGCMKRFVYSGEECSPWYGPESFYEKEELDLGLAEVLEKIERSFGPGGSFKAVEACITLLSRNNEKLGLSSFV